MYVYNVTMFTMCFAFALEHVGNFGIRLPPGCVKPLCHRMTSVFKMYAANLE